MRVIFSSLIALIFYFVLTTCYAEQDLISLFPIEHYNQTVSAWIKPADSDFDKPLLNTEIQQKHVDLFYEHYFGSLSPWSADYVTQIIRRSAPDDLATIEQSIIANFNNGYGANFRPHDNDWIEGIAREINVNQLQNLTYQIVNRGITVENLHARVLPTEDVHFYSHKLAGEGYPFDNLQMSAVWAGTPVYILAETRSHAWMLVLTPDVIAWVKSNGIARVSSRYINAWTETAIAAITHTQTSLIDTEGNFLISAYVGSVFPAKQEATGIRLLVPAADLLVRIY